MSDDEWSNDSMRTVWEHGSIGNLISADSGLQSPPQHFTHSCSTGTHTHTHARHTFMFKHNVKINFA